MEISHKELRLQVSGFYWNFARFCHTESHSPMATMNWAEQPLPAEDVPSFLSFESAYLASLVEKALATHSSTLAWKLSWKEEPGRLQFLGSWRVRCDWVTSLSLFTFMHWRRNGNPLQCSCLENPRDRGAWWAAVYGVTQSRTRLKRLSSSSSQPWPDLSLGPWRNLSLFMFSFCYNFRNIFILYWTLVDLQCVSFRYTAKWFSYTYIYISFFKVFFHLGYYRILMRVPCAIQ